MTEPEPNNDENKANQESAKSPLVQDVGAQATDEATDPDGTSDPKKEVCKQSLIARIWTRTAEYWESFKEAGKSNRLIAVATVVIAVASFLTWREAHDAGDQTDRIIAADQRLASAMESSVGQATNSFNATVDQFRLEQRAWLGASNYTYTITESKPIHSVAMALNTGKTPAMEILCRITGTTKPKSELLAASDIIYPANLPIMKQGAIFPNQFFPMTAGGPKWDPGKQKIWFKNVSSGEWIQCFFGDIRYTDVFGNGHWTHFCTQYVPETKSGTPCPIYNDAGDDKKQSKPNPSKPTPPTPATRKRFPWFWTK
jgi:hypothetical protein